MRVLALTLGLVLACSAQAYAAAAFAQTPVCAATTTVAFGSAPTNGHVVIGQATTNQAVLTGLTMLDSHSVSYTSEQNVTIDTYGSGATLDKVVAGSPTATYTFSIAGGTPPVYCIYDLSGVNAPGTYASNTTAGGATTLTATIAGVGAGDLLICAASDANAVATSLVISNGSNTSDFSNSSDIHIHATATSTASTTCTLTVTAGAYGDAVVFADYPATATGASSFGLSPHMGVYPGGQP